MNTGTEKIAGSWMSKNLIRVSADDSLSQCYEMMRDKRIRHLPVTDAHGNILGILSDRDLQRAMVRSDDSPVILRDEGSYEFEQGATAQDFMSWPVQMVDDSTSLRSVAERMLRDKISALLVRNQDGMVDGILTTDDMLKALVSVLGKAPGGETVTLRGWSDWQGWKLEGFLL